MKGRLWFPQLDLYDAVRRMAGLLAIWPGKDAPSVERLYIADFYLANPELLHNTHMPRDVRELFQALAIRRPDKVFIEFPSAPVLFKKMEEVQRQAIRTFSGKGLLDLRGLDEGKVVASPQALNLFVTHFLPLLSEQEQNIEKFLTRHFVRQGEEIGALRQSTGLRRAA